MYSAQDSGSASSLQDTPRSLYVDLRLLGGTKTMRRIRRRVNESIAASHRRFKRSGKKLASHWYSSQTLDRHSAAITPYKSYDFHAKSTKVANQVATNVSASSCEKQTLW